MTPFLILAAAIVSAVVVFTVLYRKTDKDEELRDPEPMMFDDFVPTFMPAEDPVPAVDAGLPLHGGLIPTHALPPDRADVEIQPFAPSMPVETPVAVFTPPVPEAVVVVAPLPVVEAPVAKVKKPRKPKATKISEEAVWPFPMEKPAESVEVVAPVKAAKVKAKKTAPAPIVPLPAKIKAPKKPKAPKV